MRPTRKVPREHSLLPEREGCAGRPKGGPKDRSGARSTRPARGLSRAALAGIQCVALGRGTPNDLHRPHHPHCRSLQRQVEPGPHGGLPADPSDCRGIQRQLGRPGGHDLLHFPVATTSQLMVHDHQAVGRADEEVNPSDNSLAIVQPCGDGIFGAKIAAGPRGRDPRKESLE